MASFAQEYSGGLTISVVGHALLLLMFGFNLITMSFKDAPPVQLAIEATVVDMGAVRKKQEDERRRQLELERQQQAAEAERREKAEAKEREQQQQRQAEQKRIADQKRKADAEKKKVADQKRKAEAARVAEQKRKEAAARAAEQKRKAAERRREEERQRQFQSEIEAEEERIAAVSAGKLDIYRSAIMSRVLRNWIPPASAKPDLECEVSVTQIPGGDVVNVRVGRCNGDAAVIRSVEAAVYKASPLPPPPDPSLFDRNLRFTFKP